MSHTLHPLRQARLQRSELAVPGSNPAFIEKAAASAADYVFLDLEDAVAPSEKEQARKNVDRCAARHRLARRSARPCRCASTAWTPTTCTATWSTSWSRPATACDTLLVPKVGVPADLYVVETLVDQVEQARGYPTRVGHRGADRDGARAWPMSRPSPPVGGRLEALHFGVADYAASNRARTVSIGGLNPDYPGDQWHFAL